MGKVVKINDCTIERQRAKPDQLLLEHLETIFIPSRWILKTARRWSARQTSDVRYIALLRPMLNRVARKGVISVVLANNLVRVEWIRMD